MTRLVLVHGSVTNGGLTWPAQAALAEHWSLEVLDRPGFPGGPAAVGPVDFERDAAWLAERLRPDDHLAGHSYGGVVCLLAAAARPVRSLTVVEPPAFGVARGDAAVDEVIEAVERHWRDGPREPEAFLRGFLEFVGTPWRPPSPLPPDVARGAELLMTERLPSEAELPWDALRDAAMPTLVVSGGHSRAFEIVCDTIAEELSAERLVLRGYGHVVQIHAEFNARLEDFVRRHS